MANPIHTTRWSLVARAGAADLSISRQALGELCEQYWQALYAFVRRSGRNDEDARDLVQSFCATLIERGGVDPDRERGRFRHYLLGAFRHFLANERRSAGTKKRGGHAETWSWGEAAETYEREAATAETPERLFERRWALDLLQRATARLRASHQTPGKRALWEALEPVLPGEVPGFRSADVAARLSTSEGAVRVALHRLRGRLRELIRDEVLQTLADPDDLEDELAALRRAVAGAGNEKRAPGR